MSSKIIDSNMAREITNTTACKDKLTQFFNDFVCTYADIGLNYIKFCVALSNDIAEVSTHSSYYKSDSVIVSLHLFNEFVEDVKQNGYNVTRDHELYNITEYVVKW